MFFFSSRMQLKKADFEKVRVRVISHIILTKASQGVQIVYLKSMHLRGQEGRPKRTGLKSSLTEVTMFIIIMVLNSNQNTVLEQTNKNYYY